jgi:hypothetical protein
MRRAIRSAAFALLGAAVLPSAAGAGGFGTTIVIDGGCDVFSVLVVKGVATMYETTDFGCGNKHGVGISGASKAGQFGRAMVIALQDQAVPGTQYLYEFSWPLGEGTWTLYATTDGISYTRAGSGTYHTTK